MKNENPSIFPRTFCFEAKEPFGQHLYFAKRETEVPTFKWKHVAACQVHMALSFFFFFLAVMKLYRS